jgi:hypothetical protein
MNIPVFIEPSTNGAGFCTSLGTPFNTTIEASTREELGEKVAALMRQYVPRGDELLWIQVPEPQRQDLVGAAHFISPATIAVTFRDGFAADIPIERLEMPLAEFHWDTIAASATGDLVTVADVDGESIPIDASTLRYLADDRYARQLDAKIRSLHVPKSELQEMLPHCKPPQAWYDESDHGLMK